jgi:hypothetical protein
MLQEVRLLPLPNLSPKNYFAVSKQQAKIPYSILD